MKSNSYYLGILATSLLVLTGSASFATTATDPAQLTDTTDHSEGTSPEGTLTVSIGEGSNETVQHYTYTPRSVEINAGESVTWFSSSEFADIHTVTFVQDPGIVSNIFLPFATPASGDSTDLELLPPFNLGEPTIIPTPDGRQGIVALNKNAFYPAVVDANNVTTYLEGTDIEATLNSTVKALNSGILLYVSFALLEAPPMSPTDGAQPNSTEYLLELGPPFPVVSSFNQRTFQPTEGATVEQLYFSGFGPPFPVVSSFKVTFEEPGTYPYFCAIHPRMVGQVVVREET
jgi:plastocyanin